jgi:hypothetical protein
MTKELREKVAALRAVAPMLNATTEEVGTIVKAVEAMLTVELNLSINVESQAFDQADRNDAEGQPIRTSSCLGYGRVDGKYRIYVSTETGELDHDGGWLRTVDRSETPWSSCPRDIKLRSFVSLPDLLGRIADEAERLATSAAKAAGTVRDLLVAMGRDEVEQADEVPVSFLEPGGVDWDRVALRFARDAFVNHFTSACGTLEPDVPDCVPVYFNNELVDQPERISLVMAEFRERMRAHRIKELGFAIYPPDDPREGQSGVILLPPGNKRAEWAEARAKDVVGAMPRRSD